MASMALKNVTEDWIIHEFLLDQDDGLGSLILRLCLKPLRFHSITY